MTPLEIAKEILKTSEAQMNRYPPSWKAIRELAKEVVRLSKKLAKEGME